MSEYKTAALAKLLHKLMESFDAEDIRILSPFASTIWKSAVPDSVQT